MTSGCLVRNRLGHHVVLATYPEAETDSLLRLLSLPLGKVGMGGGSVEAQRGGQPGGRGAAIVRGTVLGGGLTEAVHAGRVGAVGEGDRGRAEAHRRAVKRGAELCTGPGEEKGVWSRLAEQKLFMEMHFI